MPAEARKHIFEEKTGSGLEQEAGFAERRDALFERIAEGSKDDLSQRMRAAMVSRVFEHSIEDGMRLAERVSLTPKAYQYSLTEGFAVKHPEVYGKIHKACTDQASGPAQNFSDEIVEMLRVFQFNREQMDDLKFDHKGRLIDDPTGSFRDYEEARGENPAFKQVDDLYAMYIATQGPLNIAESKDSDNRSKGQRIGEAYLAHLEPVLAKSYYTGPIKDRFPDWAQHPRLGGPTVDEDDLRGLLRTYNLPEKDILEQLKPARVYAYAEIDAAERGAAKGELLKELRKSLPEGMKVELDGNTNSYRIEEKAAKKEVSKEDERSLELLNAVHDPSREKTRDYRTHWKLWEKPEERRERERIELTDTRRSARALTDRSVMDREMLQEYLSLNPAVPDRNPERLAVELFRRMAPSAQLQRPLWERFKSVLPSFGRETKAPVSAGVQELSSYELHGGGGEELADTRRVLESRDEIHDLLVTGVYGSYDKQARRWEKTYFPVSRTLHEPVRETTLTLQDVTGTGRAVLPMPPSANLITERVKGITDKGKEVPLVAAVNSLGEASVEIPKNIKKLGYSIEMPLVPPPMMDVDQREYEQFVKSFNKQYGREMTAHLAQLPHDVSSELRSRAFIALSPKAKVERIEEMCRELGYYDTKNEEMSADKRGKSPEEQIAICEGRMEKIRRGKKDPELAKKRFAGVCADYALISCAMLRASGIPAGILTGFGMNGKEARMNQSHATAFVAWPDGKGGIRIVPVDGTPSSADARVAASARPTIATLEQQATMDVEKEMAEADKVIEQLLEAAKAGDEASIRKLTNGKLENALNIILRFEVKRPHLQGVTSMLEAYWYGGIQRLDTNAADIELRKTMEDAIVHGRGNVEASEEPAGTQLLETVRTFLTKFEKSGAVSSRAEGFKLLDHIADLAKGELGAVERRALAAVITYLKAKRIQ